MKAKGIKRGQTIELLEQINLPDGIEITVEIELPQSAQTMSASERLQELKQLFGAWRDQSDLDLIFAEIDAERHSDWERPIDSFDD